MEIKTANVGEIDEISHVVPVRVCTTSIGDLSPRLSAKWHKTHHDPGETCWIDGTVSIFNDRFEEWVKDRLEPYDVIIAKHAIRNTLAEEYEYILEHLNEPYLSVRYKNEPWEREMEAFADSMDAVLVNPRFFAIKDHCRPLMQRWWELILEYTIFDQSQITHLLHVSDLNVGLIEWEGELDQFVTVKPHIKLM